MVDTYCAWHVLLHTTHLHFKTKNSIPFFISISPKESRKNQEIHTPAIIYNKYFCIKGTNYKPYTCTVVIFSAAGTVFHLTDK